MYSEESESFDNKVKSLSRVRLLATPWTVAHQAPLSMGFSRQEYWSGLPSPSPGDLPHPFDNGVKVMGGNCKQDCRYCIKQESVNTLCKGSDSKLHAL